MTEIEPRPSPRAQRAAFEREVLPHLDLLQRSALRLVRDEAAADDLVQDALLRAYRAFASFTPGTSVRAWLLTILRNTFINGYHQRKRRGEILDGLVAEAKSTGASAAPGVVVDAPAASAAAASAASYDERLDRATTRARIDAALETLPEDYRTAVVLADLEGLSYREIADAMASPIGTVMSRIHRGRKQLHRLLFDHAVELGMVASVAPVGDEADNVLLLSPRRAAGNSSSLPS